MVRWNGPGGMAAAGCALALAAWWGQGQVATAATVTLKSGMRFEGKLDKIASLAENALAPAATSGEVALKPIVIIDDDLRFTFVPYTQVAAVAEGPSEASERIKIKQSVADSGRRIGAIGPILKISPFDEYGRRTFSVLGPRGPLHIIQGITEITPTYTKVEGLRVENPIVWRMYLATSSIPRETLSKVLLRQIDPKDADGRLRVVRLYMQSERYLDAVMELEKVVRDFPDLAHLKEQADRLRQALAEQALREIELRREAGQHQRVNALLNNFPKEGVAGEILLKVRDMLGEYEKLRQQGERALQLLDRHVAALKEEAMRFALQPIREEIRRELNIHTLNRMADYLRLADDDAMTVDQKLALAITGWLLGSGAGAENLAVALSLVEVRNAVVGYLRATRPEERAALLEKLKSLEGASPKNVALILENIKPPLDVQEAKSELPGLLELTVPGIEEQSEFRYYLQLPPEYDPYRRYPCVVTLNGGGSTERMQIDWWAGAYHPKSQQREGQGARRGYIVLAPQWQKPGQTEYGYTVREHAAVLFCLRDACRRFAIHTDRVFLSGHSMGGDAAWDIGLAHPDLWAGVIPIVAKAARDIQGGWSRSYVHFYTENARGLPLYFVGGGMDANWHQINGTEWDNYMKRANYDCTVVAYQGRGHEDFSDEIQRVFAWMELPAHRRDFFPREFKARSMRPWDNFFWCLELAEIPPRSLAYPEQWPPGSMRPIETSARILDTNRLSIDARSGRLTIWLSPKMLNFERPMAVAVNGRELRAAIVPSLEVLLEDVRTRGDRQNPFWAKLEWPETRK